MSDKSHSCCKYGGEYEIVEEKHYKGEEAPAKIALAYAYPLTNTTSPQMTAVGLHVTTAPGGATPPHRHGPSAVAVTLLSGTAYNKMNDEPTRIVPQGGSWYEAPGCHHVTSANASETEDMVLLATAVVPTSYWEANGMTGMVILDDEWQYLVEKWRADVEKIMGKV